MTPFELAINDIFNTPDFLDVCVFRQKSLRCIVSAVSEDGVFGQFGFAPPSIPSPGRTS